MSFFDLNFKSHKCHTPLILSKEMAYEYRENGLLAIDGIPSPIRISKMRRAVPRQIGYPLPRRPEDFKHQPAPDVGRQVQRHRILPGIHGHLSRRIRKRQGRGIPDDHPQIKGVGVSRGLHSRIWSKASPPPRKATSKRKGGSFSWDVPGR